MNDVITIPNAVVEVKEGKIQFKNFDLILQSVNDELALYNDIEVTEETKQKVKDTKAKLNKIAKQLDDERKVQEKVYMIPFENFKGQVKTIVETIKNKSSELDEKIKAIEQKTIDEKTVELRKYFEELLLANKSLSFVKFSQIDLKINLTNTVVKLKKEIDVYLKGISDDLEIINSHPLKDRLMVKYLTNNYDIKQAQIVLNKEIELEQQVNQVKFEKPFVEPIIEFKEDVVEEVVEEVEDVKEVTMVIKITKSKAKLLSQFMTDNGILLKGRDY